MNRSITERSARLTTGRMASSRPEPSLGGEEESPDAELMRILDKEIDGRMPVATDWDQEGTDPGCVIERPAWISFVAMLQLHFPDMATDLEPAVNIGQVPPVRVVLTQDAIQLLNKMMGQWYGPVLEVHTVELVPNASWPADVGLTSHMERPYRPVTGLDMVVVRTLVNPLSRYERRVIRNKEMACRDKGRAAMERAICFYVRTEWSSRVEPPDPKLGRRASLRAWTRLPRRSRPSPDRG